MRALHASGLRNAPSPFLEIPSCGLRSPDCFCRGRKSQEAAHIATMLKSFLIRPKVNR